MDGKIQDNVDHVRRKISGKSLLNQSNKCELEMKLKKSSIYSKDQGQRLINVYWVRFDYKYS